MHRDYCHLAQQLEKLVEKKQEKYGDSVTRSEQILKILYPNGIQPEQYGDVLLVARILDKLSRIATDKHAFGESPYKDLAGYGLLGWAKDEKRIEEV